jgi:N6-adenosine-specific RNA methylase IME4
VIAYPDNVRALVADPPWPFEDSLPGGGRGAAKHYDLMTVEEIKAFPMPAFDPAGAWLFLWRVASMQPDALDVLRAWGFTLKAELVWVKQTQHDKLAFGMGRYVRNAHEVCLIGVRGRVRPAVRNIRSVFYAPVGRHSQKPDEFYDIVRALVPEEPRVELFARQVQPGFYAHGRELPGEQA